MSRMKYDSINVIDLECLCWEDNNPKKTYAEIIEIGIAQLNCKTLEITKVEQILIRPEGNVSEYCTNLTGLTWDKLRKEGLPFLGACNRMIKNFGTISRGWAAFGEGDNAAFKQNCVLKKAPYPLRNNCLDISSLIMLSNGLSERISLQDALTLYGIEFEGTPHKGVDDAYNTAKLLSKLLLNMRKSE